MKYITQQGIDSLSRATDEAIAGDSRGVVVPTRLLHALLCEFTDQKARIELLEQETARKTETEKGKE